jgi:glycosyltransferase involved in cell wall biosynthesis
MKPCVIIPCFNHVATVASVAQGARLHCPVFVVDDGSTVPLPDLPECKIVRLEKNAGKGAALRAGFKHAAAEGFTHAITMEADGQPRVEDLPKFLTAAEAQPEA